MQEKKDLFTGFIHKYLHKTMSCSSLVDYRSATTYLEQWLGRKPISEDFTLASLLYTDFTELVPFGADLNILIGLITSDTKGIDLHSDLLGHSSEEINQFRAHVCIEVLYGVERKLEDAHKKIIYDAHRATNDRCNVTQSLFLHLLICGIAIGCAIKSNSPGACIFCTLRVK